MRLINQQGYYLETTGRHIIMFRDRGFGSEAAKSWVIQLLPQNDDLSKAWDIASGLTEDEARALAKRIIENEVRGVKFFNPFEAGSGYTPVLSAPNDDQLELGLGMES